MSQTSITGELQQRSRLAARWHSNNVSPVSHDSAGGLSPEPIDSAVARRQTQAIWALIALGVAMRLARFLPTWPLWGDEAFVAASFLDRSYLNLLRPLEYHQVCPLLFLWIELTAVKLFGYSEHALRLFPFVAGLASLLLFRRMASRVVSGVPLLLAVGIFAVSYYPVRHSAEVKPYSSDLFAALLLTTLAVEWLSRPKSSAVLWGLALAVPFAIALSHPAVFVAGGIALALLPVVYRRWDWRCWLPYAAYGVALVGTFLLMFSLFTARQYNVESGAGGMGSYWANAFPPITRPVAMLGWLVDTHTGVMMAHPVGGKNGASTLTFLCVVVAVGVLVRQRRLAIVGVLLAPLLLAFFAAALHKYPYGGSARVMLYVAPAICLLMGSGGATMIAWGRSLQHRRVAVAASIVALATIGAGTLVGDMLRPFKTVWDCDTQGFARWFWRDQAYDAELVCVRTDLGQDFFPQQWEWGRSAVYLCNQRIYSPRHQAGQGPAWERVSATHPLRCVMYSVHNCPRDDAKIAAWLGEMRSKWTLAGHQQFRVAPGQPTFDDVYDIYEFVPRDGAAPPEPPLQAALPASGLNR